jgi:hypothetical protein
MGQNKHFHFKMDKGGCRKGGWDKARLKASRTNIKFCTPMCGIQVVGWSGPQRAWAAFPLWPCHLPPVQPSLSLAPLLAFALGIPLIPRISKILGSPLQLGLYPHSFMITLSKGCLQCSLPCYRWPGIPGLLLKSLGGSLPWPYNSFPVYAWNITITWMTPSSLLAPVNNQASWCHCYSGVWVPGWISMLSCILEKQVPRRPCVFAGCHQLAFFLRESLSNEFTLSYSSACVGFGSGQFLRCF